MQLIHTLALTLATFIPTTVFAAPAPAPPGCFVPDVLYTTLDKPFSLSVSPIPFSDRRAWPLQLDPIFPTAERASRPVISQRAITPPIFRLTDGRLIFRGFPAEIYPTIEIWPPVLVGWGFGGPRDVGGRNGSFGATYTCDVKNNVILRLRPLDGASGFAVERFAELQKVWIKPEGYQGNAIDVELKIVS